MSADIVQAQYEQLEQLATRFAAAAETQQALLQRVNQRVDVLRQGGWQGKGVAAFLREMDGEVGPAVGRLIDGLDRADDTMRVIVQTLKMAEQEAARLFQGENLYHILPFDPILMVGPDGSTISMPGGQVPPRIYVINGINNDGSGNVALQEYLLAYRLDESQVVVLPGIYSTDLAGKWDRVQMPHFEGSTLEGTNFDNKYLSPLNWLTDKVAGLVNSTTGLAADGANLVTDGFKNTISAGAVFTNSVIGAGQTLNEYLTGGSTETYIIEQAIRQDLLANPLAPNQDAIIMAHSGGSATGANSVINMSGLMIPRTDGTVSPLQFEGLVTLGSPVFNRDAASRLTRVVEIRHEGDFIGWPVARSDERRSIIHDLIDRNWHANQEHTIRGNYPGLLAPHTKSYFDKSSTELRDILNDHFGLGMSPKPL